MFKNKVNGSLISLFMFHVLFLGIRKNEANWSFSFKRYKKFKFLHFCSVFQKSPNPNEIKIIWRHLCSNTHTNSHSRISALTHKCLTKVRTGRITYATRIITQCNWISLTVMSNFRSILFWLNSTPFVIKTNH